MGRASLAPSTSRGLDLVSSSAIRARPIARSSPRFSSIRETLRSQKLVSDRVFDAVYPSWARQKSSLHWTPVHIAVRAATLLAERRGARLLDIGAGVGKFCIVAAAAVEA